MTDHDRDLREIFGELRRVAERSVPPFRQLWRADTHNGAAQDPRGVKHVRWIAAAAAVAAIVVTALVLNRGTQNQTELSISEWKAPTDFLLRTPGHELLATVPRLGVQATADAIKEPLP